MLFVDTLQTELYLYSDLLAVTFLEHQAQASILFL